MGFAQPVIGAIGQASQYDAQKRQALIQGEAQKQAAYSKATAMEQADKRNLDVVGDNMARMAGNKRRGMGAARAASAATGFAQEGSNTKTEELLQEFYALQMSDMARRGNVASMNSLNEQIALRRGGDEALRAAQAEAAQYQIMAKASRTAAWMNAIGGIVGAAGGAISAGAGIDAPMSTWGKNEWGKVAGAGINGGDAGAGLMSALNPFTAKYASRSWDSNLMDLFGIGRMEK